jgi:hypothetical protein
LEDVQQSRWHSRLRRYDTHHTEIPAALPPAMGHPGLTRHRSTCKDYSIPVSRTTIHEGQMQ